MLLSGRYRVGDSVYGDTTVAVHRGYDQVLNRTVTIELLRAGQHQAEATAALRDKARRMATAELPHVAALYDQGEHEDQPYLVLEELLGVPLADAAPLPPSNTVALIEALATTLRAARNAQTDPPRIDDSSVRITADGRTQIVNWGARPALASGPSSPQAEVAILAPLLALATTGSSGGNTNARVPASLQRVVDRALGGQYASLDALETDVRATATVADEPTVAVRRAPPTIDIGNREQGTGNREQETGSQPLTPNTQHPTPARRRSLLLAGAAALLLLALVLGANLLRRTSDAAGTGATTAPGQSTAAPGQPTDAPNPTVEPQGTPYVVDTIGGQRLRVRSGPGTNFPVVAGLDNGVTVRVVEGPVTGGNFRWVRIESDGAQGWCVFEALAPR